MNDTLHADLAKHCMELEQRLSEANARIAMMVDSLKELIAILDLFEYESDEDSCTGASFFKARINEDHFFIHKHNAEKIISASTESLVENISTS